MQRAPADFKVRVRVRVRFRVRVRVRIRTPNSASDSVYSTALKG